MEKEAGSSHNRDECYRHPAVHPPSLNRVAEITKSLNLDLTDEELKQYTDAMASATSQYQKIFDLVEPKLPIKYPRTPGYKPSKTENPLNAWYWKCDIRGAPSGKLQGKTIAIKDNIPVAGVPMMNGSLILDGFIPDIDATVITRVLDQGARIVGKATCEDCCYDSSSFTSGSGPVKNPYDPSRVAGGSSSGCAVLIAMKEVDMALGSDQGGSIRTPASCCGIVGLKPTFGLVPYTGIASIEMTLDHTGPMARTVYDVALLLESIAGIDGYGLDPRQPNNLQIPEYAKRLSGDIQGIRVGLVKEGFNPQFDSDVNDLVRKSAERLGDVGAVIEEVSIAWHIKGYCTLDGLCLGSFSPQGITGQLMYYDTHLQLAIERGMKTHPNDFSHWVKLQLLNNRYMREDYNGIFYSKAQNLRRELKKAYDEALKKYDVLIMPTLPKKPPTLPDKNCTVKEYLENAGGFNHNTAIFCITGHPALTINAGLSDGLPVGMMIVGKMFDESTVLNVAYAYEQLRDMKNPSIS